MPDEAMFQAGEEPVGRRSQQSDQVAIDISEDSGGISEDSGDEGLVNHPQVVNTKPIKPSKKKKNRERMKMRIALYVRKAMEHFMAAGAEDVRDRWRNVIQDLNAINCKNQIIRKVYEGNWEATQEIYKKHKLNINANDEYGRNILHYAARTAHVDYVTKLVQEMSDEGLNHCDNSGVSALSQAAMGGVKAVAQAIIDRNDGSLLARNSDGTLPLYKAAIVNHKDMAAYLYEKSQNELKDEDLADFCCALIARGRYEFALNILNDNWERLATCKNTSGRETVLHEMARNPGFLASTNSFRFSSQRRFFNLFAGILTFEKAKKKRLQRSARELLKCMCEHIASLDDGYVDDWDPLFIAAARGNVEFLKIFILTFPYALYMTNKDDQNIFHIAVLNRHEEIFKLIHDIGPAKAAIAVSVDRNENLLTHMAGKLSPLSQLNAVPGAALQLQRELIWFQEVKKVIPSGLANAKNKSDKTADDVFMDNHQDLIRRGEEWMRNTANSCLIVATLVATVVFAAAFTAPGGYNQTTGFPVFLTMASFQIFLVADAISLIFSVISILTFLSVLTSTYQLKDFVQSLPARLLFGLTTLFVSITTMMVAFVTVFFLYFKHDYLFAYALPMAILASVPICWFIGSHARLFVDVMKSVLISTFRPNYKGPLFSAPKKNKST